MRSDAYYSRQGYYRQGHLKIKQRIDLVIILKPTLTTTGTDYSVQSVQGVRGFDSKPQTRLSCGQLHLRSYTKQGTERATVLALLGLTAERRTEQALRRANRAIKFRLWGPCQFGAFRLGLYWFVPDLGGRPAYLRRTEVVEYDIEKGLPFQITVDLFRHVGLCFTSRCFQR